MDRWGGRADGLRNPEPDPDPDRDVTVANLNVLHGLFCSIGTDSCRLEERLDLLFDWIEGSGCPDVITLQEITAGMEPLLAARRDSDCGFGYEVGYERFNAVDDAIVLSRYPVSTSAVPLYDDFRHAMIATIDHPNGPLTIVTTHLASGSDGATDPCGVDCPTECVAAGASTVRQCQAVQLADVVDGLGGGVVTGDFNAAPGSFEYDHLVARGWVDTYLEAGNTECEPASGDGCSSGRQDEDLSDMEAKPLNQTERIDFIFDVGASTGCELEATGDRDRDGVDTGGFAHRPNPFEPDCGPAPLPICWPSDHSGVAIDLNCL